MLYRIDWEYDEYVGAGEWETKKFYQYVFGLKRLGKACLDVDEYTHIARIVKLNFSFKGLWVCLNNKISSFYNQTA